MKPKPHHRKLIPALGAAATVGAVALLWGYSSAYTTRFEPGHRDAACGEQILPVPSATPSSNPSAPPSCPPSAQPSGAPSATPGAGAAEPTSAP